MTDLGKYESRVPSFVPKLTNTKSFFFFPVVWSLKRMSSVLKSLVLFFWGFMDAVLGVLGVLAPRFMIDLFRGMGMPDMSEVSMQLWCGFIFANACCMLQLRQGNLQGPLVWTALGQAFIAISQMVIFKFDTAVLLFPILHLTTAVILLRLA